jgi:hypothetical protein
MRRAASVRPAQRLEHGLAAQRHRLDGRRPLGDAEDAHDVEAAAAGARDRARAPQRRQRRAGQHRVGAAPVAGAARCRERLVERRFAGADRAEPRQRRGMDGVRFRLAGGVAGGDQHRGGRRHRVGGGA